MSRTDKTDPVRVKMLEHPVQVHDHRDGLCELASDPWRTFEPGDDRAGRCYVTACRGSVSCR